MPSSFHQPPGNKPHVARRRFGQHFLHEAGVIDRLLGAIDPREGEFFVEIGPGEGALTFPLLQKTRSLHVVELDRDLAARLRGHAGITLHEADALTFDFGAFPAGMRLVGNLPYNISTPLLFHLAAFAPRVRDMHFMLQREVVERMVAASSTPEYGRLSVALQTRFAMKKLFTVAAGAFRPPPKVASAVVRLVPLSPQPSIPQALDQVLREAFSARRKTLRNALRDVDLAAVGIDAGLRPENLTPADYLRIAETTSRRPKSD
ncbi:MAG: 16S rRNA (adenine(1518)-N(6)/adenine(1519)-N(6))-dimethyltransferase RsmA [Betaproteobacteria bacterium]